MQNSSLDKSVLGLPVRGRNLVGESLGQVLAGQPTLLFFLRHLG